MDERTLRDLIREARPEVSDQQAQEWSFRVMSGELSRSVGPTEDEPTRSTPRRKSRKRRKRSSANKPEE